MGKRAELGLTLSPEDFADVEAVAAIARFTGGNFRLVQRLCAQIERVLRINELRTVTAEVVEAARESLVIGNGLWRSFGSALWREGAPL